MSLLFSGRCVALPHSVRSATQALRMARDDVARQIPPSAAARLLRPHRECEA
jgi:hypothetical protein